MPQGPLPASIAQFGGAGVTLQANPDKSLLVAQGYPDYYLKNYNGLTAVGAAAGVTTSAALATTYTGLCLSNPIGSSVNLALLFATALFNVAPTALTAVGLIAGYNAATAVIHTTPATVRSSFVGAQAKSGYTPVGLLDTACTLPTAPYWERFLMETATATTVPSVPGPFDLQGTIIIPPGGYLAIGTSIAGPTAGLFASFTWMELPQ